MSKRHQKNKKIASRRALWLRARGKVLVPLDAVCGQLEDLEQWLDVFSTQLVHMRKDIDTIETRNNRFGNTPRRHADGVLRSREDLGHSTSGVGNPCCTISND